MKISNHGPFPGMKKPWKCPTHTHAGLSILCGIEKDREKGQLRPCRGSGN